MDIILIIYIFCVKIFWFKDWYEKILKSENVQGGRGIIIIIIIIIIISHEITSTWLRKENLKRETESLLIAV